VPAATGGNGAQATTAGLQGDRHGDGRAAIAPLALDHISVAFGGVTALADVALSVAPGEVVGLIGPNGAGKTTLFDVITGIRAPDAGRVLLGGSDVTTWTAVRRARAGLRRTFQQPQVFGWLSVVENVQAALDWRGGGGGMWADLFAWPARRAREAERRQRVDEVLELCKLSDVANKPAGSLPIGRTRAVELARAVADKPTVLLLDEPNSGLDDPETGALGGCIQSVRKELGCAIVLVEHDVGFVMDHCDRIIVLNLGQVLMTGTCDEARADPAVRSAYLG